MILVAQLDASFKRPCEQLTGAPAAFDRSVS